MVTRKEYMTQMERLRNERSEEICKQFRTLKEENAGFKPWRIIGIIARELGIQYPESAGRVCFKGRVTQRPSY